MNQAPSAKSEQDGSQLSLLSRSSLGFIKELVDEQAAHDVSRGWYDEPWECSSRFESIVLVSSIAIVTRKSEACGRAGRVGRDRDSDSGAG